MSDFVVKDSGVRQDYPSGMRRDTQEGKTNFLLAIDGPMFERYAAHMTKGAAKYGARNWQLAASEEELERFKASALRHLVQWLRGERDEDHAAAVWFNVNAAEHVRNRLADVDWDLVNSQVDDELYGVEVITHQADGQPSKPLPLFPTREDFTQYQRMSDYERQSFYVELSEVEVGEPTRYHYCRGDESSCVQFTAERVA